MKHQYTFVNVNKTVFEFFSVSHLTEEMVKFYTIQQHLPTITYEFQTNLKYCFKYKIHVLAIEVYYIGRNYTHTTYMNVPF